MRVITPGKKITSKAKILTFKIPFYFYLQIFKTFNKIIQCCVSGKRRDYSMSPSLHK